MCLVEKSKTSSIVFLIILTIFSAFFCCNFVKANELDTLIYDYNTLPTTNENYEKFKVQMEEVKNYLDNYKNDYYYLIYFNNTNVNVYLYEKKDNFDFYLKLSSSSSTLAYGSIGSTINYISFSFNTSTFESNFITFKNKLENKTYNSKNGMSNSSSTLNNGLIRDTFARVYYTNFDNFRLSEDSVFNVNVNGVLVSPGEKIPTIYELLEKQKLILKKESSFNYLQDGANSLKYIDLYFDKEDFQKQINYRLEFKDYNSMENCGFNCDLAEITNFDIAYLVKDENGFYKWIKDKNIGVYIDHDTPSIPKNDGTGFDLTGIINLNYDESIYTNIEQIKVSIGLSSAFNYSYAYYDNSNIVFLNIDDYFSNMMGLNGRLYRNKQYDKYSVISTNKDIVKDNIVIEYVLNTYHLYLEYFDISLGSYIDKGMLNWFDHFSIQNREFEKYSFEIGKTNEKGLYLMNYLYHNSKDDEELLNEFRYYYFYIPLDLPYYNSNYLDETKYYDIDGDINDGVVQNPNQETDNIQFIDNFRSFFKMIDDLEETRIFFNDGFNAIYSQLPLMIKVVLQLVCHFLCIAVLLEMLGWGDY